jgi:hypothetical protein
MTKLSCKTGDFASSVVVLKDGRAMEVRRGKVTDFTYGPTERQYWPTVDAWKATLPEGAEVKEDLRASTAKASADKWATTNPVLARFIVKMRAYHGESTRRSRTRNCYSRGTRRQRIQAEIYNAEMAILRCKGASAASQILPYFEENLAKQQALLAKVIAEGKADETVFVPGYDSHFLTLSPDGDIQQVYYNVAENVIFRINFDTQIMTPITDMEAPFWAEPYRGRLIKI